MEAPNATTVKRKKKQPVSQGPVKFYTGKLGSIRFFVKFGTLAWVLTQAYFMQKKAEEDKARKATQTPKLDT